MVNQKTHRQGIPLDSLKQHPALKERLINAFGFAEMAVCALV